MEFLRVLEGIRNPALDFVMATVTHLGAELCFLAVGVVLLWCVNKRVGYYFFAVGFLGLTVNQWLKLLFCVPRPWQIDPTFTIVEAAREGAEGFSFPSGHTHLSLTTFGILGLHASKKWQKILCWCMAMIIPFSRMYLGVHTPADVGTSLLLTGVMMTVLWFCFHRENWEKLVPAVLALLVAVSAAFAVWVSVAQFPPEVDAFNLEDGVKNSGLILGCLLGICVSYAVDVRYLHYTLEAPLPGQVLKTVLGFGGVMAVRAVLKTPLSMLIPNLAVATGIRYFCIVIFAAVLWPMTFPFFAKLGTGEQKNV